MGVSPSSLLSNEECLQLLEEERHEEILLKSQDYIHQKVEGYLKSFKYYHQYNQDFYQEVCIHILTKSLPSAAFQEAIENGNTFRFYLAKIIRNTLNTLLNREKNKRQYILAIDGLYNASDDDFSMDRTHFFEDNAHSGKTDSQDLLDLVFTQFEKLIRNFQSAFPKISDKLILLLKLQARVAISLQDLKGCFPKISLKDQENIQASLADPDSYLHCEDKEIYEMIQPYFLKYRQEKGSPAALQRWLNQHISGNKFSQGILDKLEIKDAETNYKIKDKKLFADFLHLYFQRQTQEEISQNTQTEANYSFRPKLGPTWLPAVN